MLPQGRGNNYTHRPYARGRSRPPMHYNRGNYRGASNYQPRQFRGREGFYEKRGSGFYRRSPGRRLSPSPKRRRSSSGSARRSASRSRSRSRRSYSRSRSRSPDRRYSRSRSRSVTPKRRESHSQSFERERNRSRNLSVPREHNRSRNTSTSSSSSSEQRSNQGEPKAQLDNLTKDGTRQQRSRSGSIDLSLRITVGNEKYLEQKTIPVLLPDVSKPPPPLDNKYGTVLGSREDHHRSTRHPPYVHPVADVANTRPAAFVEPKQQPSGNSQLLEAEILKHISAMPSYLKDDMAKKEWLLSSLSGVLTGRPGAPPGVESSNALGNVANVKPSTAVNYGQSVTDTAVSRSQPQLGSNYSLSTSVTLGNSGPLSSIGNGASSEMVEDEDLYLYGDESATQLASGSNHASSNLDSSQEQVPGASRMAALVNDPTIESILKSIGISMDPTAMALGLPTQANSLEQSIDQGSSFLSGGTPLPPVDFGKVFAKDDTDSSGRKKRRRVPDTYESYEERARKYREEQMAAMTATYQTVDQQQDDYGQQGQYGSYYDDGSGMAASADAAQVAYGSLASIQQYDSVLPHNEPTLHHDVVDDYDNQGSSGYVDYHHGNRDFRPPSSSSFNEYDSAADRRGVGRNLSQREDYDRGSDRERFSLDDGDRGRKDRNYDSKDSKSSSARRIVRSQKEFDALKREIDVKYTRLKLLDRELGRVRHERSELLMRPKWDKLSAQQEGTVVKLTKMEQSLQREIAALQSATEESEQLLEESRLAFQAEQQRQEEETKRLAEKKFAAAKAESNASADSNSSAAASSTAKDKKLQLDFVDGGNHYCRLCCTVSESIDAFCKHLHDKKHRKLVHPEDRPWAPINNKTPPSKVSGGKQVTVPFRGSEFVLGVRAFYCTLCREFSGDADCALTHLKSKQHDEKYQQYVTEYPVYEKNLALERNAGVAKLAANELVGKSDSKRDRDSSSDRSREKKHNRGDGGRSRDSEDKKKLLRQSEDDEKKRMVVGEPGTKDASGSAGVLVWKGQTQKCIRIDLNSSDSESEASAKDKDNKDKPSSSGAKSSQSATNDKKKNSFVVGGRQPVPPVGKSKWEQDEDGAELKGNRSSSRFSADSKATRDLATELLRKKAENKAQKSGSSSAAASVDMFQSDSDKPGASGKPLTLFPIAATDNSSQGKDRKEHSRGSKKDKELKLLGLSKNDFSDLKATPPPPTVANRPLSSTSAAKNLYGGKKGGKSSDSDNEGDSLLKCIEKAKRTAAELAVQAQSGITQPYVSENMPTLADKQAAAAGQAPVKKTLKITPKAPPSGVIIAPLKSLKTAAKTKLAAAKPVQTSASSTVVGSQPMVEQKDDDAKSDTSELNAGDFDIVDEL